VYPRGCNEKALRLHASLSQFNHKEKHLNADQGTFHRITGQYPQDCQGHKNKERLGTVTYQRSQRRQENSMPYSALDWILEQKEGISGKLTKPKKSLEFSW
jgi:hypothetical protein